MLQLFKNLFFRAKHGVQSINSSWDDPLDVWRERLEKMSWQEALEYRCKFVPRGYWPWEEHDQVLWEVLSERLFRIEQPIFRPDLSAYAHKLLVVANGCSDEKIKKFVEHGLVDAEPKIVIELCGRLRGFALSPQLVIAGITAVSSFPRDVLRKVRNSPYSLLTEADAVCVQAHWDELEHLMSWAGVPGIQGLNYFLLQGEGDFEYPVWSHELKSVSFMEHDDYSALLAKL